MTQRSGHAFAGVLLVTLLGIVGMHGLGSHGLHGSGSDGGTMAAHLTDSGTGDHATGPVLSDDPGESAVSLLDVTCVAILIGLAFVLRTVRHDLSASAQPHQGRTYSIVRARSPKRGPPTLAELSILRC